MHDISIFGTSSDAGKSTIAFALTYLLHQKGFSVAPFKAQNVSNNSKACDDGSEIAEPQHFAANAIGLKTTADMNPILIKSGKSGRFSLIVNGKEVGDKSVQKYFNDIEQLKPVVQKSFLRLKQNYDIVVAEGAGSPVELNLMEKDLSNLYIAQTFQTKIILVADIERGGVFASIWGVYNLLPKELQSNVIGVIVNKFRGDQSFFDAGVKIIENEFKIPVLGVIPYRPFNLGFEDTQSLINYKQKTSQVKIGVAVINLPHMSNFTDFEPLIADNEVDVRFVTNVAELSSVDICVVPGTKRTIEDLAWLRQEGFADYLKQTKRKIVAICGGYEMMFEELIDDIAIESDEACSVDGLALLEGSVKFEKEKMVSKGSYEVFGQCLKGYEIHHGVHKDFSTQKDNIYGTFMHGLFDNDSFRKELFSMIDRSYKGFDFFAYKEEEIEKFALHVDANLNMQSIVYAIKRS